MKNQIIIISLFALIFISFSACHKKNDSTPAVPKGLLYFHLHTDIDTNEVDSGVVARDSSGRQFALNVAEFYICNIVLHKSDGSTYSVDGAVALKTIAEEEYYIDSVPTGNYTSVSFSVGLNSALNSGTPSSFSSGNVLGTQTPGMWFGAGQGYIFMNLQGLADTTVAQAGPVNVPFTYQLGTSSQLVTVTMPQHAAFGVIANQQTFIHMIADYGKALRGVNLGLGTATPFNSNAAVTTQIANNIATMFRYEE
jgi:hypothetical protein